MKAILQRVLSSSVMVNGQIVSAIGQGVLVLAAIGPDDTKKDVETMASKIVKMRLWPDENGVNWKKSVQDVEGEILCVSQFTLMANTRKGTKPDFHGAAKPELAKELYDYFVTRVCDQHGSDRVKDGVFQAMMQVSLVNDGPVTIEIDTSPPKKDSASSTKTSTGASTPVQEETS
ncbi:D-tyrosyl-tRNA(Tyr) deacylase [Cladophialophora bantiana CBS 173.52]|uniref:D-aminoacyl-tRNA deacylase n=1 Tax=Cladophialophora bantiana (strain ATCC 10958 / CBS 173.52 / CDC B-1940 / NIH 8579) TaxID=1442370 RepID=A0A0D2FKU0_CLAB1|nr:D-tyrosyl-tRNA(Tyr) deacylase [Cladophialophora bantiana CBS 173.52]KIW87312.1 D-tyrosyl-tRNA(Tyr) deacylase [Cladophialophora bantiana CBS 173.52]